MKHIIDLTLTMRPSMRGVSWEQAKTTEIDGWNTRNLHLYSHAGTHMDAQTHFAAGPGTIDHTPLERCMGVAWVIDLAGIADRALITIDDLGALAESFPAGDCLLLRTDWSKHIDDPQRYRDQLPRISQELARWCVEKQVNVLGVEPPSVADVNHKEELILIHKILLEANITIVEGLTNLDQLTEEKVFFIAAPLKIEGGDGAPCRAFAMMGDGNDPVFPL
jgi:arylformamidase